MSLWQYLLLLASVLVGGGIALNSSERWRAYLPVLLSFSGAYLLGIAALELIPEVFADRREGGGLWLLIGFMVQLLLEGVSQGVEHGHVHLQRHGSATYGLQVMIGLGLHAFLEGLPLATGAAHGEHLLFGIVLHKLPAAFALGLLLVGSGYRASRAWVLLAVFALCSPAGALLGEVLSIDALWRNRILAVVVGSFLHISTTILFESDATHRHGISLQKFFIVLSGMVVAYLTAHH
jgi:zinc transporter ZupT